MKTAYESLALRLVRKTWPEASWEYRPCDRCHRRAYLEHKAADGTKVYCCSIGHEITVVPVQV